MTAEQWVPAGVDVSRPNIARVYDCFLGGTHNFPADREVYARALAIVPGARGALDHRAFLRRVVRYLVTEAGIGQFLDIGCGLPTQGNVHQIAREAGRPARVVYVDNDPVVIAHSRALLAGQPGVSAVLGDLRQPEDILASPQVRRLIDFSQPAGLCLLGILHHLTDSEGPAQIAATLRRALAPGSYAAISHFYNPGPERPADAQRAAAIETLFSQTLGTGRWRTRAQILSCFGDLELAEPGLVPITDWRPDPHTSRAYSLGHHSIVGGVGRKK